MAKKIAPNQFIIDGVNHVFTFDQAIREIRCMYYLGDITEKEMESAMADVIVQELAIQG